MDHGYFPIEWKVANLTLIKKPDKTEINNPKSYRPISLLPIIGKIFEKILNNRIVFELRDKLSLKQYGFQKGISAEHAAFKLVNDVNAGFKSKKITAAIFCDIAAAFDGVFHDGLVAKLHKLSVSPVYIRLVKSFLTSSRGQTRNR